MRVLVVTPDYPPAHGGIQLLMARLVAALPDAQVGVGTMGRGDERTPAEPGILFRVRGRGGRAHKLSMALLNARAFLAAVRHRPDVVIAGHVTTAPAAALAQRLLRIPFVQYVHADEFRTRASLSRWAVRRASLVIAVSRYAAALAESGGASRSRIEVVLPGVDPPPPRAAAERDERPTVLTVARMVAPYKGHDRMLEALPAIRAQVPAVRWVVIGDGPRREEMERRAREAGLGGSVSFLGSVDDGTRDGWLRRAHLFAMPSRLPPEGVGGEGFGIVYLEASSYGLPVVAGNAGGATDAVRDGETGVLVDPEDPNAIAAAIAGLLADPARAAALGSAGAERARELSWQRHGREVRDALARVVAEGAA